MTAAAQHGFPSEADMLGLIAEAAAILAGPSAWALYEIPSAAGVPDVVFAEFTASAVAGRAADQFLDDQAQVGAVMALARRPGEVMTAAQLSWCSGVSARRVTAHLMPTLIERGWAVQHGHGLWAANESYVSPVRRLVTVEAKVRDWRRGLHQAARHATGTDQAWLVLDAAYAKPACGEAAAVMFERVGVGLATLAAEGGVQVVRSPTPAEVLPVRRELLAQRAARMFSSGQASGVVHCVFGRYLHATLGPDPRLVAASG